MTPSLWTEICLLWAPEAIEAFAARSGDALLSVNLPPTRQMIRSPYEPVLLHLTEFVTTNMHRIRSLDLDFFSSFGRDPIHLTALYENLSDGILGRPATQLEIFRFTISNRHPRIQLAVTNLFRRNAPLLRTIYLEGCSFRQDFDPSTFNALVSLSIRAKYGNCFSEISQITKILSHAHRLVDFTFEGLGEDHEEYCEPRLSPTIVLPHCMTINLRGCFSDQIAYLFSELTLPSLRSVTINGIHRERHLHGSETKFNLLAYLPAPFRASFVDAPDLVIDLQDVWIALEVKASTGYRLFFREESAYSNLQGWERPWATQMLSAPSRHLNTTPTRLIISVPDCHRECRLLTTFSKETWIDVLLTLPALSSITINSSIPIPATPFTLALADPIRLCPALVSLEMACLVQGRDRTEIQKMLRERTSVTFITGSIDGTEFNAREDGDMH